MTSLPEKLVAIIAPHACVSCSNYNNVLCDECVLQIAPVNTELCFACNSPCSASNICKKCAVECGVTQAFIGAMYDGDVVKVIKMLKFERAKAAASPLARILCNQLPLFCEDTIIVPVPTTSSRVRQRGYNQSMLIAKHIGKEKQLKVIDALGRDSSVRQLGASRQKRHEQIKDAFYCKKQSKVVNRDILLIDDVVTTGATLKAAAKILYASGAANIYVATVAKTPPASVKQ